MNAQKLGCLGLGTIWNIHGCFKSLVPWLKSFSNIRCFNNNPDAFHLCEGPEPPIYLGFGTTATGCSVQSRYDRACHGNCHEKRCRIFRSPHTLDTASLQFSLSYNILWRTDFDSSLSLSIYIYIFIIYKYTILYIYIYSDSIIRLWYLYLKQLDLVHTWSTVGWNPNEVLSMTDHVPWCQGPQGIWALWSINSLWNPRALHMTYGSKAWSPFPELQNVCMDVPCWWYCFFDHFDQSSNLTVDIVEIIVSQYDF